MLLHQLRRETAVVTVQEPLTGKSHIENVLFMRDNRLAIIMLNYRATRIYFALRSGAILATIDLEHEIRSYGSIDDVELFYLLPQINQWGALNILTFEHRKGHYEFQCQKPYRSKVHFFPLSMSLAVFEMGTYNSLIGKLTFLQYPVIGETELPKLWSLPVENIDSRSMVPLNQSHSAAIFRTSVAGWVAWQKCNFKSRTVQQYQAKWDIPETDLSDVAELPNGQYLLHLKWVEDCEIFGRLVVYDSNRPNQPLKRFKACPNDRIHSIMSFSQFMYCFEWNIDALGRCQKAPLRAIDKLSEQEILQDTCLMGSNRYYYRGGTQQQYVWSIEVDSFGDLTANIEKLWVGRHELCSDRALTIHLLRQKSKGRMTVDMLQAVVDIIEWEDDD